MHSPGPAASAAAPQGGRANAAPPAAQAPAAAATGRAGHVSPITVSCVADMIASCIKAQRTHVEFLANAMHLWGASGTAGQYLANTEIAAGDWAVALGFDTAGLQWKSKGVQLFKLGKFYLPNVYVKTLTTHLWDKYKSEDIILGHCELFAHKYLSEWIQPPEPYMVYLANGNVMGFPTLAPGQAPPPPPPMPGIDPTTATHQVAATPCTSGLAARCTADTVSKMHAVIVDVNSVWDTSKEYQAMLADVHTYMITEVLPLLNTSGFVLLIVPVLEGDIGSSYTFCLTVFPRLHIATYHEPAYEDNE